MSEVLVSKIEPNSIVGKIGGMPVQIVKLESFIYLSVRNRRGNHERYIAEKVEVAAGESFASVLERIGGEALQMEPCELLLIQSKREKAAARAPSRNRKPVKLCCSCEQRAALKGSRYCGWCA